MEITIVGSWILLGLGILLVLAAIYLVCVRGADLIYIILLIFGVLCAGVGTHGPLFMGQYAKWLEIMLSIVKMEDPDPKTYRMFLERIAKGDFDPELQEIALNYLRNHPTQDLATLLTEAINSASNEQGKKVLQEAKQELVVKIEMVKLLSQKLRPEEIKALDPATQMLIKNELKRPPKHELNRPPASNLRPIEQLDQLKPKLEN